MDSYETGTAIHFIIFAIVFTSAFGFAAWRIVRNLEQEDEVTSQDIEGSSNENLDQEEIDES